MNSTGARLKKSRLEKKLTIDEVYKRTKIHPDVLLAIEEDRFSQFNPVYLRGFLKIYSRFLGMNPQEIIEGYQDTKVQVETVEEVNAKSLPQARPSPKEEKVEVAIKEPVFNFNTFAASKSRPEGHGKDAPLSINPEAQSSLQVGDSRRVNFSLIKPYLKTAAIFAAVIIALVLVFKVSVFAVGRIKAVVHAIATRPKKTPAPAESKDKAQAKAKPVEAKPQEKTVVKAVAVTTKPVSSLVSLAVRAKEDCYIHLKSDGKTVFQGVLKKGFAEVWSAKNKMELTVGNAGGIDVEVNGNLIPPLGKRKQSIKNIVITKEGLSTSG